MFQNNRLSSQVQNKNIKIALRILYVGACERNFYYKKLYNSLSLMLILKRIVHPNIKILSLFTQHHFPNQNAFLCNKKGDILKNASVFLYNENQWDPMLFGLQFSSKYCILFCVAQKKEMQTNVKPHDGIRTQFSFLDELFFYIIWHKYAPNSIWSKKPQFGSIWINFISITE